MNFYKRFVGDFQRDTGHLSLAEVGAYDRLLDHYYATERALPGDVEACCRIARAMTKDERKAVDSVLRQFFTLEDDEHRQARADRELSELKPKIAASRTNGGKGGRPRKNLEGIQSETKKKPTGFLDENPAETHIESQTEPKRNLSQSQKEIPSVPIGTGTADAEPTGPPASMTAGEKRKTAAWRGAKSLLNEHGMPMAQTGAFIGKLASDYGQDVTLEVMEAAVVERPAEPSAWMKAACQSRAGKRKPTAHSGFQKLDYREGISADGSFS
jgi:uncharacterized protein YdaU (DUF1376 family)